MEHSLDLWADKQRQQEGKRFDDAFFHQSFTFTWRQGEIQMTQLFSNPLLETD